MKLKKSESLFFQSFIFIIFLLLSGCIPSGNSEISFDQIEEVFTNAPDSIQTSAYWYWMSDNVSKEGVIKDLQAMKKAGINRAFIGNIGGQGVSYGPVKMFTDEWWKVLHTALKTATELDIEIGIFNSPGWSQSGGPWVSKEQSMRYLNSAEIVLTGPMNYDDFLPVPDEDFQFVNVVAYKMNYQVLKDDGQKKFKVIANPARSDAPNVIDGKVETELVLRNNQSLTLDFTAVENVSVKTLYIKPSEKKIKAIGELLVKESNGFRSLKKFEIDRSNSNIHVGFDPYAPIVISIPATHSNHFRLVIDTVTVPGALAEINLSTVPMVERYPEKSLAKMFQSPLPYWDEYMWEPQPEIENENLVINPDSVINITSYKTADGKLVWNVPEGSWKVIHFGMTSTGQRNAPAAPEGNGLETDKMSKEHIESHFDAYMGEVIRRIPAEDRKTWKVVVQDSYETGGQNWTDGLAEDFQSKYGYDPVPFLPVLKGQVVGSRDQSDRFLWDLRRIVADKIAYDYVAGLREVSHKHDLTTWLENYGHWGFPGEFLQYGGQSDEVSGEFWSEGDLGDIENRAASSCAHIYGKRKVSAESFTCGGNAYSRHPATMKQRGDRFFAEGINNTLLHVNIHQPDEQVPGYNAWFGNEFNRHNTWYDYMPLFTQYLKRANYMLQQGTYVAEVAYFIGEDAPKMTGVCDPELPKGYSFDYINAEVIQTRLSVQNGRLVLPDGLNYRLLVLPKQETMRPELLEKIKELVLEGAVILGPAPKYSPSLKDFPEADDRVQQLAAELWGEVDGEIVKSAKVGKGMVLSGMEMEEALDLLEVRPDVKLAPDDPVMFIHRTLPEGDVYFVTNQEDHPVEFMPDFRITGKRPEIWNPVNGTIRSLPSYQQSEDGTRVPLKLHPFESYFIIFRHDSENGSKVNLDENFPDGTLLTDISEDWTVSFNSAHRGPKHPVVFKTLDDWTLNDNDSIKFYSGTAVYRRQAQLEDVDPDERIILNLGNLTAMAKIKVNNVEVGGAWTAPYEVDITSVVKSGINEIEVLVVNNWMNRLIGDMNLPESERPLWSPVIDHTADTPLQPSGLFGPVVLKSVIPF